MMSMGDAIHLFGTCLLWLGWVYTTVAVGFAIRTAIRGK